MIRPSNNYNNINTLVKGAVPLTKFIKIQKVLTDTSTEASLCRRGAGEREKCERAGDDGKGKSLPIVPRALIAIFTGIPSGSLCRGERSNRYFSLGALEGNDGAVARALASHQCDPGSNLGVDDICGC